MPELNDRRLAAHEVGTWVHKATVELEAATVCKRLFQGYLDEHLDMVSMACTDRMRRLAKAKREQGAEDPGGRSGAPDSETGPRGV